MSTIRVAVLQAEPAWLDLNAATIKTISLIEEASQKGAQLVAFPETWIPGYPAWIWSRPLDTPLTIKYAQNALSTNSPQMRAICAAAKNNRISVCLGYAEREDADSGFGSLYISQCLIAAEDGEIKMVRRKIKPTHMERTVFGEGGGGSLRNVVGVKAVEEGEGKGEGVVVRVGCLACWEHTQPLLKYHTSSQSEQIHIAAWPPLFDYPEPSPSPTPTQEPANTPLYSLTSSGAKILSRSYAIETQSFVLHSTAVLSEAGIDAMQLQGNPLFGKPGGGHAAVFGPDGRKLSRDLEESVEGMIVVGVELGMVGVCKGFLDVVGHYSRPDLLRLVVDCREKRAVSYYNMD